MKKHLAGKQYWTDDKVISAVKDFFKDQDERLSANTFTLWETKQGTGKRGRKRATYISVLMNDTGLDNVNELKTAMLDRLVWRCYIHGTRDGIG